MNVANFTASKGHWMCFSSCLFLGLSLLFFFFGSDILKLIVGDRAGIYAIENGIFALAVLGFAISLNIFCVMLISATERPHLGWKPMGFAVLANGFIGVPLVIKYGVIGAFVGNATTSMIAAILILTCTFKVSKI